MAGWIWLDGMFMNFSLFMNKTWGNSMNSKAGKCKGRWGTMGSSYSPMIVKSPHKKSDVSHIDTPFYSSAAGVVG
jgi:hypothetical protein